tara:strand:+ start:530 stop:1549 length:1020 start_codon:yes stop_codon:yes gene_type:complete
MAVLHSLQIPHESSPKEALEWFQRSIFSDIPPYFMTHWKTGKKFFYAGDAMLAFEETPQHLIVAGEPLVAAGSDDIDIYNAFLSFAQRKKKTICGYYVGKKWSWSRFFKVPLGTSIRIPLDDFDIQSPDAREVRRSLRKGQKLNYQAVPVLKPLREDNKKLQKLFKKWHRAKLPFHLKFFLSKPKSDSPIDSYEEWFVVERQGEPLAFCSLLPYLRDGELGFYVDHLIYDPKRDPHALSFLISFLIEVLKEEGVSELNLGLNPFARSDQSSLMGKLFGLLYHIPWFYRPKGLHFFKRKFTGLEEREYCFFQSHKNKWLGLADMAKVTLLGGRPPARPQV